MRLPVSPYTRQVAPASPVGTPMAREVPLTGVRDAAQALYAAGATRQKAADAIDRDLALKAAQSEHEMLKSRVMGRIRDDRLKWLETLEARKAAAPEGADGFTPAVLADFDKYTEAATKDITDPTERSMYSGMLGALREHVGESSLVFQADARRTYRARTLTDGLEKSARLVTVDPSQMPEVLESERALIRNSADLTAEQRAKLDEHARDTLSWAAAQTVVDRDPDGFLARVGTRGGKTGKDGKVIPPDIAKATAAVQGDAVLSNLPPARLQQAIERATMLSVTRQAQRDAEEERRRREAEIAADRRERAASQAFSILSGRAMSGVATDPVADKDLLRAIEGTPYASEYRRQAEQVKARTAVAMMPLDVQRAQIDQLIAERNTKGTSTALEAEIKFRKDLLQAGESNYRESPLRGAQQYGLVNVTPLDTTSFDSILQGMPARALQADTAGRQTGTPASPLLPEEVPKLAGILNALPAPQRAERLASLASRLPPAQAQALAGQLATGNDPQSKALGVALALGTQRTTAGRTTAEIVLRGAEALKLGTIKEEKTPVDGWRGQIAEQLKDVYPNPQQRDMAIEAARLVLAGLVSEGASGTSGDAKMAVRLAIGGSLREHNGARIPIPAGMELSDLTTRLRSMPPEEIARQSTDGKVYIRGQAMPAAQFVASLPDARLQYAGRGRYYVQTGGTLAANSQGEPIVIEVGNAR